MSDFLDITAGAMATAFAYMQADSVTYQGVTVDCVCGERESEILAAGGFQENFVGFARVLKAGFPVPSKGDRITVNGNERRITFWDEDPISWKLHLEDVTR